MKRGKDEKIMGPMFPRLHVNDTDKRGPRAPPRNKMALYEQLSIPSNRFNRGDANLVHSPSQGVTNESAMLSSYNLPTRPQPEKQIKNSEDDDFTVPIFLRPVMNNEECREYINFNHQSKFQNSKKLGVPENSLKQESNSRNEENVEKFATDGGVKPILTSSTIEKAESKHGSERCNTSVLDENLAELEQRNDSTLVNAFLSEDQNSLHDSSNRTESQLVRNLERVDSLSENSVVDSISGRGITPDDVVGIIGRKHFWKARREIVNQQRIFAIQVFELHRLIKVQKLIAASPHILLEDSGYFTKPIEASPEKRKPLNNPVKEIPYIPKQKGEHEELIIHKNKSSVENATEEKASSFTSFKTGILHANFRPVTADSPARAVSSDCNFGPWGFNLPTLGNQWLIPVMSPSEGLVYKPYPGPRLVGPDCGGCGPLESNQLMGNFPYPLYGVPSAHTRYQFSSSPWAGSHGYFAPYGMPRMNNGVFSDSSAKQMNGSPSTNQVLAQDLYLSANPCRKNRASQDVPDNLNTSEDIEAQAIIASSHVDRDNGHSKFIKERNVLPLFPTVPPINGPKYGPRAREPDRPVQVIKVVPHNARSASESAARIFQAIQEGRKQYDSV